MSITVDIHAMRKDSGTRGIAYSVEIRPNHDERDLLDRECDWDYQVKDYNDPKGLVIHSGTVRKMRRSHPYLVGRIVAVVLEKVFELVPENRFTTPYS